MQLRMFRVIKCPEMSTTNVVCDIGLHCLSTLSVECEDKIGFSMQNIFCLPNSHGWLPVESMDADKRFCYSYRYSSRKEDKDRSYHAELARLYNSHLTKPMPYSRNL